MLPPNVEYVPVLISDVILCKMTETVEILPLKFHVRLSPKRKCILHVVPTIFLIKNCLMPLQIALY